MKRATHTAAGMAVLVVLFVLGVFSAGSASAHTFSWTGPLPSLILILSDGPQIFHFLDGFVIICKHYHAHVLIPNSMSASTLKAAGEYSKCVAESGGFAATVTPVEYEINAEGTLSVVNKPITLTIPAAACSLKISAGAPNTGLGHIVILKLLPDILFHLLIRFFHFSSSGGFCGETGIEHLGAYLGLWLVFVHGGTMSWA